jgi:hypothetical protein
MAFRISGLKREQFEELFRLDDDQLLLRGAKRYVADAKPGFPCRVSLIDATPGENVILLPFKHQAGKTPYSSEGPIFVRENGQTCALATAEVPESLRTRLLSVRAYDMEDMMFGSDVVEGSEVESLLNRFLSDPAVSYLHVHFAKAGCYACRVDRINAAGNP